ncbi:MAG: fibronectin type III domain-containing protein, partial [Elusimicrobia bacterium]|nr:fibronectin type III domain-containing protein [Elusimicrobiota bacterium]
MGGLRQTGSGAGGNFILHGSVGAVETTSISGGVGADAKTLKAGLQSFQDYPTSIQNVAVDADDAKDSDKLDLTWSAPSAEMEYNQSAVSYVAKYSLSPITTQTNFQNATTFGQSLTPGIPGSAQNLTIDGLQPNTQYYVAIEAYDRDNNASYLSNSTGAYTHAVQPSTQPFSSVELSSITFVWKTENVGNLVYQVQMSTDNFASVKDAITGSVNGNVSSSTLFNNGIMPGYDHYFRVRALNTVGAESRWSVVASTRPGVEPPGIPGGGPFSGINTGQIIVTWTHSNSPGFRYRINKADDSLFTVNVSTRELTNALTTTYMSLSHNTTYHFRVLAMQPSDGLESTFTILGGTMTLASPVVNSSTTSVYATSATFQWTDNSNTNNIPISYRVEVSTKSFAMGFLVHKSSTVPGGTNVPGTYSSTIVDLLPNTNYYGRVFALNKIGAPSTENRVNGGALFLTDPVPLELTPTLQSVLTNSIWMQWVEGALPNNPSGTRYLAEASTSTDFYQPKSSNTLMSNPEPSECTISDLLANTTYNIRLRAVGKTGRLSAPIETVTVTRPLPPASPYFQSIGETNVTVAWDANSNGPATRYRVTISSTGYGTDVIETRDVQATSANFVSLSTNTNHYFTIMTIEDGGWGTDQNSLTINAIRATRAAVPEGTLPPFTNVYITSATVGWSGGTNPSGTIYRVEASTAFPSYDPILESAESADLLSRTFTTMVPNTMHYFRAQAKNRDGVTSNFYEIGSTVTLAAVPTITGYSATPTSLTIQWNGNNNPSDTEYLVTNTTTSSNSNWITGSSWTDTSLSTNTAYRYVVKARSRTGTVTDDS